MRISDWSSDVCSSDLLPYTIFPINIGKGEQFQPHFLDIAPNNRIPAIVDHAPADGGAAVPLFESGAILLYLADKTKQFIPDTLRCRADVLQWLFWKMGGLGPMAGHNHHFNNYAQETITKSNKHRVGKRSVSK